MRFRASKVIGFGVQGPAGSNMDAFLRCIRCTVLGFTARFRLRFSHGLGLGVFPSRWLHKLKLVCSFR